MKKPNSSLSSFTLCSIALLCTLSYFRAVMQINPTLKKSSKSVHPITLFSPSHAVSAGRNPVSFSPSYFRCFLFFPNCDPVSLWFPSCPGNKPWLPFPQCVVFTIPWSYCFLKCFVVGLFGLFFFLKYSKRGNSPFLSLSFTHLSVSGWSSHCISTSITAVSGWIWHYFFCLCECTGQSSFCKAFCKDSHGIAMLATEQRSSGRH